jgi:hypothetical protein
MPTSTAAVRERITVFMREIGVADAAADLSPRDPAALDVLLASAVARFAPGASATRFSPAVDAYLRAHRREAREGYTGNWTSYQALLARDGALWDEHRHKRQNGHLEVVLACQPCSSDYDTLSWTDGDCLVAKTYDAIAEHVSSIIHIGRVEAVEAERRQIHKLLARHSPAREAFANVDAVESR